MKLGLLYLSVFLGSLVSLPLAAFARPSKATNGDRLARGLPPLRPERLFNASSTGPSLARRSSLPTAPFKLALYAPGETTPICYVGSVASGSFANCVPLDEGSLYFTPTQPAGSSTPGEFVVYGSPGQYLTALSEDSDQGPDTYNPVLTIALGSNPPTGVNGDPGYRYFQPFGVAWYETDIYYTGADGTVTAVWFNGHYNYNVDPESYAPLVFWLNGNSLTPPTTIQASAQGNLEAAANMGYDPVVVSMKAVNA